MQAGAQCAIIPEAALTADALPSSRSATSSTPARAVAGASTKEGRSWGKVASKASACASELGQRHTSCTAGERGSARSSCATSSSSTRLRGPSGPSSTSSRSTLRSPSSSTPGASARRGSACTRVTTVASIGKSA